MTENKPSAPAIIAGMIADWQAVRRQLAEFEAAEHPPITDEFGRVWTWKSKSIYVHCSMAWTKDMVLDDRAGLPTQAALDNPNCELCDLCLDGRARHVSPCKPEWNCSHPACSRIRSAAGKV